MYFLDLFITTTLIYLFCLSKLGGRIQSIAGGQYLDIQDVRTHDSGQYSCVVTNIAGSTSLFFTVEILCKFVPLTLMIYQAHMNNKKRNVFILQGCIKLFKNHSKIFLFQIYVVLLNFSSKNNI